jgi:predicted SprT family Zn-dependent metalloprotease
MTAEQLLTIFINNKIYELEAVAKDRFNKTLTYPIKGKINNNIFRTVGRWSFSLKTKIHLVEISGIVHKNITESLKQHIAHEYAHAFAYEHFKDNGHGYWWKHVMYTLGYPPERLLTAAEAQELNYKKTVKEVKYKVTKHVYACACREHLVSPQKHNKIQKGHSYICNSCKSRVVYKNEMKKV